MDEQIWDEEIDLRHYIEILLRWKWIIIIITLLAGIGAFVVSGFLPKTYESSATVAVAISQILPDGGKPLAGTFQVPDFRFSFPLVSGVALSRANLQQVVESLNLEVASVEDFSQTLSVKDMGATSEHLLIGLSAKAQDARDAQNIVNEWSHTLISAIHSFVSRSYFEPLRRLMAPRLEDYFQKLEEKEAAWREFNTSNPVPVLEAQLADFTQRIAAGEAQLMDLNRQIAATEMLLGSTMKLVTGRVQEIHTALSTQERFALEEFQKSQKALEDFDRQHNLSLLQATIDQVQAQFVDAEARLREISGLLEIAQNDLVAAEGELKSREKFITLRQAIARDSLLLDVAREGVGGDLSRILGLSLDSQVVNPVYSDLDSQVATRKLEVQRLQKEADVLRDEVQEYSRVLQGLREEYTNLSSQREMLAQKVASTGATYFSLLEQKSRIAPLAASENAATVFVEGQYVKGEDEEEGKAKTFFPELVQLLQNRAQLLVDLETYKIQRDTLESQLLEYRSKLSEVQSKLADAKMQQDRLWRDLEMLQDSYAAYQVAADFLRSLDNLEKDQSLWQNIVQVVSPATLPASPISPRRMLNTAIAMVAGLFVSVLVAFFLEFWRGAQAPGKA